MSVGYSRISTYQNWLVLFCWNWPDCVKFQKFGPQSPKVHVKSLSLSLSCLWFMLFLTKLLNALSFFGTNFCMRHVLRFFHICLKVFFWKGSKTFSIIKALKSPASILIVWLQELDSFGYAMTEKIHDLLRTDMIFVKKIYTPGFSGRSA